MRYPREIVTARVTLARRVTIRSLKSAGPTGLARALVAKRRAARLTLREAAEAVGAISTATYFRAETHRTAVPDVRQFLSLCRWLGVTTVKEAEALLR